MIDIKTKYLARIAELIEEPVETLSIVGKLFREDHTDLRWGFITGEQESYSITLRRLNENVTYTVASWKMASLPGSCAYCITFHSKVGAKGNPWNEDYKAFTHRGLGTLLNQMKQDIAINLGYTVLICSDVLKNTYQRNILAKNGWDDIHTITNKRTENVIKLSVKELNYEEYEETLKPKAPQAEAGEVLECPVTVDAPVATV
jgi:hypothetical protein